MAGGPPCGWPACLRRRGASAARPLTSTLRTGFMHRVEDGIRTGKQTGIGRLLSQSLAINGAWLTAS